MQALFKVGTFFQLQPLCLHELSPQLLHLLAHDRISSELVILLALVVASAVIHLCSQCLHLVSLSIVQLLMLLCIKQLMRLGPLLDLVKQLRLRARQLQHLLVMHVQPPLVVLLFE